MSSYFDDLGMQLAHAEQLPEPAFLAVIEDVEEGLYKTVTQVTGDIEFPDDLRQKIMGAFAVHGIYQPGKLEPTEKALDYTMSVRCSRVLDQIHELFHDLARRNLWTRFGRLGDNPPMILALREEWEKP